LTFQKLREPLTRKETEILQGHHKVPPSEVVMALRPTGHASPFRRCGGYLVQEKKGGEKRRSFSEEAFYTTPGIRLTDQSD
jgi:hypothetical protein